ncbi:hypothetical protein EHQ12_01850 [Leptospira gomenensis]|uniref:Uncharacterized protein n=1 Tax=Leptospira gomenensis TaxID=2484974 RepID=A0A5F1YZK3_9LEPT|nr:hypothetical protein [Leptospira gomenensis]TGK39344.1 hypothetical protein EHQ17_00045 [Leptospira gomenensis]TGK44096.1 hypothetical protein EHQ07_12470 [Leptospira gomenensis]TGK44285.1 hypothetical protein EHQ12_01850 [Leptospira gomenensis]TGK65870.1 hypothetical protein EHQ13_04575 [Leptospira gomenensis]
MKIQHFGIIFFFFNLSAFAETGTASGGRNLFSGDTLILGGISISLLFLFGLVLKESVRKSAELSETSEPWKTKDTNRSSLVETTEEADREKTADLFSSQSRIVSKPIHVSPSSASSNARRIWKREVPTHPELVSAHRNFLTNLSPGISNAEIYFLSGEVSLLLASKNGRVFHLPESPQERLLSEDNKRGIFSGNIVTDGEYVLIPLSTGSSPFGYLRTGLKDWESISPGEFRTWKEEYEEQVSIQFESSDPETGFGNLHAFELDKARVNEEILIFAHVSTESSAPYVLKWISLWTSKIIRKQIRFYRIRKDRVAFFLEPEEWNTFCERLGELVESLRRENGSVSLNFGVSIREESRDEWATNARKALSESIEQGPNRYICL